MKKSNVLRVVLVLLVLALLAVVGVIVFKQREYQQSTEYYETLRSVGALVLRRASV